MVTKILGHTLEEWAPENFTEGPPVPQWLAPSLPNKGQWPWYKATTPVTKGTMVVTISPTSAVLTVGGKTYVAGSYPLAPGSYSWSASASGYTAQSGTITIVAGQNANLPISLATIGGVILKGTLNIAYSPSTTVLTVNGQQYSPGSYQLTVGTYSWSASAYGYYSQTGSVTVLDGQTASINANLVSSGSNVGPSLVLPQTHVNYGDTVYYSFAGFPATRQLILTVQGQGSGLGYPVSDSNGNGSGNYFLAYLDAGSYTLVLSDGAGHSATSSLTVTGSGGGGGGGGVTTYDVQWSDGSISYGLTMDQINQIVIDSGYTVTYTIIATHVS